MLSGDEQHWEQQKLILSLLRNKDLEGEENSNKDTKKKEFDFILDQSIGKSYVKLSYSSKNWNGRPVLFPFLL